MNIQRTILIIVFSFILVMIKSCRSQNTSNTANSIEVYASNPFYWQYNGEPVLLIGGSREDNLFNHPDGLEEHLDKLRSAGGNYIRNTMSSRNPGNPWPHKKLENGLYDLDQWDNEYWDRFENLLNLSSARDIIVQIEIWDPWDYFMTEAPRGYGPDNVGWESCPYNPLLNINYTAEESGLATDIEYYSGDKPSGHVFFHSIPELKDIPVIRKYQEAFVEKLLSISLKYPNVLYCMNNEIGEHAEWGEYWAQFIREIANDSGKKVFLADMRRNSNFRSAEQIRLLHDRNNYDFFEISQNTANNDQHHYDQIMAIRNQVVDNPKPLNNIKIYGGEIGSWTTNVEEGTRRFWRNIFGGLASSRFHREGPSPMFFGAGLSDLAVSHIHSMRMFTDEMNVFLCIPANHLLSDREPNEAYCLAEEGRQYAVYFPDGGEVKLEISVPGSEVEIRWLNIARSEWLDAEIRERKRTISISPPAKGQWAVLITSAGN